MRKSDLHIENTPSIVPRPPRLVAGIDIGGTNVRCALARPDRPDRLIVRRTAATPAGAGLDAFLDFLADELAACCREAGCAGAPLAAVGCAAPGITHAEAGIVVDAVNLSWKDVPLARLLGHRLGTEVTVENDVRAAALAESRYGAGTGCASLVYLTVSTGVAAGIIVGGRILRGHHHAAGELGFFLPDPKHIGQDWGENGCLEMTAAGIGIARAWAAAHGGSGTPADAEEVFARAAAGNREAAALVDRAADYLAQTAVAIGTLIDPEVLVLGGSIARHVTRIADRIREVMRMTLPFPVQITHAQLGGDAPLIGALALAADRAAAAPAPSAPVTPTRTAGRS